MNEERLALHGGEPVRKSLLPYGRQSIDDSDIAAVTEALRGDWLTTGPGVDAFEEEFAAYVGSSHAVAFSSGTAALHGAAAAAGLGPGDEALTTPFTFCATANCALYQGATPKFADIDPRTLNIDPEEVAARLGARTKVLLPVDYAGHPAALDKLMSLAKERGAVVIEDASHSLGADLDGRTVGSIADMTTFSFHPVKHLTTLEGGMVTTNNADYAERLRRFRNHGLSSDARERQSEGGWYYEMRELGYNYRLSDVACALGRTQLGRMGAHIERRRAIAATYEAAFAELPEVITLIEEPGARSAWHIYPVRFELERLSAGRKELFAALRAENIGVNVHYIPVHMMPYYRDNFGYAPEDFPEAQRAYNALVTLPLFHTMTEDDVHDVVHAVRKVVQHYRIQ